MFVYTCTPCSSQSKRIAVFVFQDVVYALAHATGRTGRFTLTERWRNNERLLAPQEHPLKVLVLFFSLLELYHRCVLIYNDKIF